MPMVEHSGFNKRYGVGPSPLVFMLTYSHKHTAHLRYYLVGIVVLYQFLTKSHISTCCCPRSTCAPNQNFDFPGR